MAARSLLIVVEPVDLTVEQAQRSKVESISFLRVPMSRTVTVRKRGQSSRYLNGGTNALMRAPCEPDDGVGLYTREQLLRMDGDFVAAVEAAIRLGLENRTSASACKRPGAGDRDRLSIAS